MNNLLRIIKQRVKAYLPMLFIALLVTACGGGGDGDVSDPGGSDIGGELIGTGIYGTAAEGKALANATIRIKSKTGVTATTQTDLQGKFASGELKEANANTDRGPYLLQIDKGNGEYFYSMAHIENAEEIDPDSERIAINIHPFTDLIVRNWFEQKGLNIDTEMSGNTSISELPTAAEIAEIADEFLSIFAKVLEVNNADNYNDLLAGPFDADQTGFDAFLDNSQVIINNNVINVTVNQPNTSIETTIIADVPLANDFTSDNDSLPSLPTDVRVLPTDMEGETLLVWTPSTDDKGVSFYDIYRDGERVGSTPYPIFFETGLEKGVSYNYTVEAIDNRSQRSGQTAAKAITLDEPDTTAPVAVNNVQADEQSNVIALSWDIADVSDVAGFDIYKGASGAISTTSNDDLVASITATSYNDFNVIAGAEYCYVIVTYDAAGNQSDPTAETCVNVDTTVPDLSEVAFSSATYNVDESAGSIAITVSRTGDVSAAASVDYSAVAGTATAGIDFAETTGTLNWAVNDNNDKTFTIQLTENAAVESPETVLLALTNPSLSTRLGAISDSVLTINDAPQVACVDLSPTTINVDTTLSNPCYNVNTNVFVRDAATLTIDPGVRLVFAAGNSLDVEADGILNATGTAEAPIVFTGQIAANGYWDGIEIVSIATSRLVHTVVEYAGNNISAPESGVYVTGNGRAIITDSVVRNNAGYGIRASSNARLTSFSNNVITLNENAPVFMTPNQVFTIDSSTTYTGNVAQNGESRDYILLSGGGVTLNQTWNTLDVHYLINLSSMNVGAELTLLPGAKLVFVSNSRLNFEGGGTLKAIGTQAEPIIFTGEQASPGYWKGIEFTFNDNDNVMDHVIVEYGGGANIDRAANVGVRGVGAQRGRLTISNSLLQHSAKYGFEFDNDIDLTMSNVVSTNNLRPGEIGFNDLGLLDTASIYSGNTDDRIFVRADSINRTQTMQLLDVPYYSTSGSPTLVDAALTIEPSVELQFFSGGGFTVRSSGTLIIDGTPEEKILLTGAQKTKGYWKGVEFRGSQSPNLINHAIIEYGGNPTNSTEGLISFYGSQPINISNGTVSNTILRHSSTNGLWIDENTTGSFDNNNTFEDIDGLNVFLD